MCCLQSRVVHIHDMRTKRHLAQVSFFPFHLTFCFMLTALLWLLLSKSFDEAVVCAAVILAVVLIHSAYIAIRLSCLRAPGRRGARSFGPSCCRRRVRFREQHCPQKTTQPRASRRRAPVRPPGVWTSVDRPASLAPPGVYFRLRRARQAVGSRREFKGSGWGCRGQRQADRTGFCPLALLVFTGSLALGRRELFARTSALLYLYAPTCVSGRLSADLRL